MTDHLLPSLEQIQLVLLNTFNPNRNHQLEAEKFLNDWKHVKGFPSSIFQLILQSQQDSSSQQSLYIQQAGVIFLKNLVVKHYDTSRRSLIDEFDDDDDTTHVDSNSLPPIPEMHPEDKQFLRENILRAMIHSPHIVQNQLCLIYQVIVYSDYPVNWINLVDEIINMLRSNGANCVYAALLALHGLLKRYKNAPGEHYRIAVNDIVERTFDIITGLFQYLLSQNTDEFATMRTLITKIVWCAFSLGTPQYYYLEVKEGKFDRFNKLLEMFLECYKIEVPPHNIENVDNPHWKVKKWVGHFAYRLLITSSTLETREVSQEEIVIAQYFVSQWSVKFLELFLQLIQFNLKGAFVPYRIVTLSFRYLDACVANPDVYKHAVAPRLQSLIVDYIFPYLTFTSQDAELWEYDPQEWLRIGYDLVEDLWNTRMNAMGTLSSLLKVRRKDAFPIYLQYVTQVLTSYADNTNVNPQLKDGILYSIGNMKQLFLKNNMTKDKLEELLLMFVFPEFKNEKCPYLRARACWMLGCFADAPFKNPETPVQGMQLILDCLKDKQIPVRVQAGLGLSWLLRLESATQYVRPILPQLLDVYMNIMSEMEHSTVVQSIELLVDAFAEEMEPYAVNICGRMAAAFIRLFEEDDNDLDNAEEDILMDNCIHTIMTLLESFRNKPRVYRQLEPVLLPLIVKILESPDEGYDFVEPAMDMLVYVTYHCDGSISENCWNLLPTIYNAFSGWAYDFIGYLVAPLDNYISMDTQKFLSNPDHVTMVYHLCAKHLAKGAETVEKEAQGACKILSCMLQHCRGAIDNEIPKYLEMVMCQIDLAETPAFIVLLLEVFADAIIYNMELALSYVESKQFTLKLFTKWFQNLPNFKRIYDKKVAVLAFSNIIGYANFANLPKPLQDNISHIVSACVKLLLEINELKQKVGEQNQNGAEENAYYDDYDSEEDEYNDGNGQTSKQLSLSVDALKQDTNLKRIVEALTNSAYDAQADDEIDEMEVFDSPIDKYDEKVYFGKAMIVFSSNSASLFQKVISQSSEEDKNALQQLMNHAAQQSM